MNDSKINRIIEEALLEDLGLGDVTTEATVGPDAVGRGEFLVKQTGVIAGLTVAAEVFQILDDSIRMKVFVADGSLIAGGSVAAAIDGPIAPMLKGERTALNLLQRMSGIATLTRTFVDAVEGTRAKITDTRKTAPGLRALDKLAVQIGGGVNHRFSLDDMALIKDNHIAAAGSITAAIAGVTSYLGGRKLRIEVETKNLEEVRQVLGCRGVDRIMLDNFPLDDMREAVGLIGRRLEVEASGGVTLANVRPIAESGVDFISVGALTHSAPALDIAFNLNPRSLHMHR
jgi:nicotinate-nucleotide pyrophosphorylase (carboxylating)